MFDRLGGRVLWGAFFAFVIATFISFLGNALWSFEARATPGKAAWLTASSICSASMPSIPS